jgi:hypothetical protein
MRVFLGVILAVVVIALVYRLTKKTDTDEVLNGMQESAIIATQPTGQAKHNVTVEEVIQATSYTYLRVKEGNEEYWIATVKEDLEVGSKYSFGEALEMNNFRSKELDRTFETILFVSDEAEPDAGQPAGMGAPAMGKPQVEKKTEEVIAQSDGGISIGELYKNRDKYANKKVRVKGKVVKVNPEVMDRNWIHLQDGTSDAGSFDLTVTSLEMANVDDIVEFEGTIILNKDFGAGYVYELIMEGGTIKK